MEVIVKEYEEKKKERQVPVFMKAVDCDTIVVVSSWGDKESTFSGTSYVPRTVYRACYSKNWEKKDFTPWYGEITIKVPRED